MKIFFITLILILLIFSSASAQITVAIANFDNNSGAFNLDYLEKAIPDFLKSQLTKSDKIIVVERDRLENILKEQALGQTGLLDSSSAQLVGNLIGAQYVIQGSINQSGQQTRIDASIIRVESGEIKNEKVIAPDSDNINEMIDLLANNILNILTGEVSYQEKYRLNRYPTTYFLAATAGLTITAILVNNAYKDKLDAYKTETRLSEFDKKYDNANNLNKLKIIMASVAGAALVGTIYCWIQNLSAEDILAYNQNQNANIIPNLAINYQGRVNAGVSILF